MEKELIVVLDFGGQYNQLIARRVRECNVYAEVHPYTISLEELKAISGICRANGLPGCSSSWNMLWCAADGISPRWKGCYSSS